MNRYIQPLLNIKYARLRFLCRASSRIFLPPFKGGTIRGTFGHVLKEITLQLDERAIYQRLFETENDGRYPDFNSKFAPKPFVIEPPITTKKHFVPGDLFNIDWVLIGDAIQYANLFTLAHHLMGFEYGIGKYQKEGFGKFILEKVCLIDSNLSNDYSSIVNEENTPSRGNETRTPPEKVSDNTTLIINFITPVNLIYQGAAIKKDSLNRVTFHAIIKSLYWRLFLLNVFHGQMPDIDFREPEEIPMEIVQSKLEWASIPHYSNRHRRKIPLDGFTGYIMFRGNWQPFLPLIEMGAALHIGRETAFGLGKYSFSRENMG